MNIVVENLTKNYQIQGMNFRALDKVSIEMKKGQFISIIGESGSGKSTLARMILGLESPCDGSIKLGGKDISSFKSIAKKREYRRSIQAVFQDASGTLNPKLSVYRNITEPLINLTDLSRNQRKDRISELMRNTNMDISLLDVPVRKLSGGEQRRLSLLRALSIRPDFLVVDEVLSGLDCISSDAVIRVLETYNKIFSCGCLFITHDIESAVRLSNEIYMMKEGKIVSKRWIK